MVCCLPVCEQLAALASCCHCILYAPGQQRVFKACLHRHRKMTTGGDDEDYEDELTVAKLQVGGGSFPGQHPLLG